LQSSVVEYALFSLLEQSKHAFLRTTLVLKGADRGKSVKDVTIHMENMRFRALFRQ